MSSRPNVPRSSVCACRYAMLQRYAKGVASAVYAAARRRAAGREAAGAYAYITLKARYAYYCRAMYGATCCASHDAGVRLRRQRTQVRACHARRSSRHYAKIAKGVRTDQQIRRARHVDTRDVMLLLSRVHRYEIQAQQPARAAIMLHIAMTSGLRAVVYSVC